MNEEQDQDRQEAMAAFRPDPLAAPPLKTEPQESSKNSPKKPEEDEEADAAPEPRGWINYLLFFLTFGSSVWAGSMLAIGDHPLGMAAPFYQPQLLIQGFPFAVPLMAILLAHEMGHYLTARAYGVDQSMPYFIPAPTLFGTFGAVILLRSQPENRSVLMRVAVMGPLAGMVLAIPATIWGLAHSTPITEATLNDPHLWFGSSLLFGLFEQTFSPNGTLIELHPVGMAGWVGFFITSLNLIPAAQLDGGHVAYALFGRYQSKISIFLVGILLTFGLTHEFTADGHGGLVWVFWAILLLFIGIKHPPVENETFPLTRTDRILGWSALLIFILTFVPIPIEERGGGDTPVTFEDLEETWPGWQQDDDQDYPEKPEEFRL